MQALRVLVEEYVHNESSGFDSDSEWVDYGRVGKSECARYKRWISQQQQGNSPCSRIEAYLALESRR